MNKRELLVKSAVTFFYGMLIVGLSTMLIFNTPKIGMLIEFFGLIVFLLVLIWTS